MSKLLPFRRPSGPASATHPPKYYELGDDALSVGGNPPRRGDLCRVAAGEIVDGDEHIVITPGGRVVCGTLNRDGDTVTLTFPNRDWPPYVNKASKLNIVGRVEKFYLSARGDVGRGLYIEDGLDFCRVEHAVPGEVCVESGPPMEWVVNWRADAAGNLLAVSNNWYTLTGVPFQSRACEDFIRAVHPDERDGIAERWRKARAELTPFDVTCRALMRGAYYVIRNIAMPVRDAGGSPAVWMGTFHVLGLAEAALILATEVGG